MKPRLAPLALALASLALGLPPTAAAKPPGLKLSERSAVPGQVVLLSAKGLEPKQASVKIGGKRAETVTRSKRKLGVLVPKLKPGKARVVAKQKRRRLRGRLKIGEGFDGIVEPVLDTARAASAEIGPAGGEITATAADGTTYMLSIPAGTVLAPTTITLTPISRLAGLPSSGRTSPAVQFGPDGLVFAQPATLRITPPEPLGQVAAFAQGGDGSALKLQPATPDGASFVVEISHFSSAGLAEFRQFEQVIARLATLPMTLPAAAEVLAAVRAAPEIRWCEDVPPCQELLSEAFELIGGLSVGQCRAEAGENPFVVDLVRVLNLLLTMEGDAGALGRSPGVVPQCRKELTRGIFDLTKDTTQSDPLGVSGPCAGVRGADYDSDGQTRDLECGLYAGFIASIQGFEDIQALAIHVSTVGLQKIVDDGEAKCDQASSHAEGLRELRKAAAMDASFGLLTGGILAALEYCIEITVSPNRVSVEVGEELGFTATARDPADRSFRWSTDRGTITEAGLLTAPDTPGPLVVTAESNQTARTGTAQVTVTCPPGQVAEQGQCRTVEIAIDPTTATLAPGATQQFTATVSGTADTRVDWSASCGQVTQAGLYTAPQTPGTCTVTAASRAAPSKQASATVTVGSGFEVTRRSSSVGANAEASKGQINNSDLDSDGSPATLLFGEWSGSASANASAGSSSAAGESSSTQSVTQNGDNVEATVSGSASASASGSASEQDPDGAKATGGTGINLRLSFDVSAGTVDVTCNNQSSPPSPTFYSGAGPFLVNRDNSNIIFGSTEPGVYSASVGPGRYEIRVSGAASATIGTLLYPPGGTRVENKSVSANVTCVIYG